MVLIVKPLILCAVLAALTACGGQSFPQAICERVTITHDGVPVIGTEDMAYDGAAQTLYLSAYDRRTDSKGGIYKLPIGTTAGTANTLSVTPVIDNIRPHGFDLTRTNRALTQKSDDLFLSFIDRQGDKNEQKPAIRTLSWNDDTPQDLTEHWTMTGPEVCAANDLARTHPYNNESAIFITQDHETCTQKAQNRENIFSPDKAMVGIVDHNKAIFRPFLTGLSFANGIALSKDDQRLYVAETRGKRITLFSGETGDTTAIPMAGGPDNITLDGDKVYAALIPRLIKFKRFSAGKSKTMPSRFAILSPKDSADNQDISTYKTATYDVPASVISGATVAIKAGEHIWLGAGYDTAIARCTLPESRL